MSSPLSNEFSMAYYYLVNLFMLTDNVGEQGMFRLLDQFPVHLFHEQRPLEF